MAMAPAPAAAAPPRPARQVMESYVQKTMALPTTGRRAWAPKALAPNSTAPAPMIPKLLTEIRCIKL